ncbi:MAG TPA: F0F1 ATP synthase subunit A, partial [Bacteroidia bacterium]|nr:F0F1 ATP synthase subunit A [Bacteroidia bacterium]
SAVQAHKAPQEEGTTTHANDHAGHDDHGTEHPKDMHDEKPHGDASHAKAHGTEYDAKGTIMHHISDAHEWHFFTFGHTHVTLPLPVILYSKENGLDVFSSSKFKAKGDAHDHDAPKYYKNYILFHEKIYMADANGGLNLDKEHHATNEKPLDISITKNVAQMILALIVLCAIFITVANAYVKKGRWVPKGIQSFMEPLILFVRDDIVKPNMGKNADRFMPYMLTLFFFIWVSNMLGLLPGSANVTGNIAVTAALALLTMLATNLFGNKGYWGHIFMPPGVPWPLYIIMVPVEIIGIFTKPFSLMIRLFANITAGHIIILSILGLIFMFSNGGTETGAGFGVALPSMLLTLFLYCLELLVAFLQAFIFTMLSSLFIGQAMEDHSHHAHEEGHGAHH